MYFKRFPTVLECVDLMTCGSYITIHGKCFLVSVHNVTVTLSLKVTRLVNCIIGKIASCAYLNHSFSDVFIIFASVDLENCKCGLESWNLVFEIEW